MLTAAGPGRDRDRAPWRLHYGLCVLRVRDAHARSHRRSGFLQRPAIARILRDDTLGAAPPRTPTFMYHATNDHLVGFPGALDLARRYCASGVPLLWKTGGGDHIGLPLVIGDQPLRYMQQRFDDAPVATNCGSL